MIHASQRTGPPPEDSLVLCNLASGSRGNATYIGRGDRALLVDVGVSARKAAEKLMERGLDPAHVAGIVLTHEHGDHARGARVFARRHKVPVFVHSAARGKVALDGVPDVRTFDGDRPFEVAGFEVQPFSPPVAMPGRAIGGGQGAVVTVILTAGLLAGLAWTWWRERRSCEAPIKAAAVTLVVSTLIAPRTSVVNQASLLLPICSLLAGVARQGRLGRIAALGLQAALLVSLWIVDLLLFPALSSGEHWRAQHRILSPILPTVLLLGLMTRRWWAAGRRK